MYSLRVWIRSAPEVQLLLVLSSEVQKYHQSTLIKIESNLKVARM